MSAASYPKPGEVTANNRPYHPVGKCLAMILDRSPEVLLAGPAGTGKTRAALEKLNLCARNYPGMRGLIVRKTRESLTESALVTFESQVLLPNHPALQTGGQRRVRQAYHYPNGSTIVLGGMDKPSKTLSTEYDVVYVQEAIELTENDWELLTRPLRHGKMPYQQIIADTNPDAPTHWLKKRCDRGQTVMLDSRHEDNPLFWRNGGWTSVGRDYIAKLDNLTGPRKQRLRFGRWVQAEGGVYEGWDRTIHLIDRFDVPWEWPRYWSIDFGYTNPFACLFFAQDHDGRLYCYREIYRTMTLVEDHAKRMLQLLHEEAESWAKKTGHSVDSILARIRPKAIVCDHDAEGRATLERYLKMGTTKAKKDKLPGIERVQVRLRDAGDGKARLFFFRDRLDGRDPLLEESKSPIGFDEEVDAYIWEDSHKKDEPVDKDNHSADAIRYMIAHFDLHGGPWDAPSSAPAPEQAPREAPRLSEMVPPGRGRLFPRR